MLRIVRNNKAQIDKLLFEAKKAIVDEGKKQAIDYIYNQVPTEQQIISKMEELSRENPKKAKQYYDSTTKLLEGAKKKLESTQNKINTIKVKLESVDSKMTYLSTLNQIVSPLVETFKGIKLASDAIVVGAGASPTTPPGPVANAATLREKLNGTVKKTLSAIQLASRIVTIITKTYSALNRKINDADRKITQLISYIENLLSILEGLFLSILKDKLGNLEDQPLIENLDDLYSYYPEVLDYLNETTDELPPLDPSDTNDTTDGISNTPPRFFRKYRKNPYTDIY